ncbi:Major facilitator super domain-containing protein 7 [Chytriomyces hyalinus]|nr:Major facilitator super domain-containing protein 7 [Chytriomyces hyalinus]
MAYLASDTHQAECVPVAHQPAPQITQIVVSKWRFPVAFAVFLAILSNNAQYSIYGSVTATAAQHFEASTTTITSLALWNSAAFIPSFYPSTWLLDTHGIKAGLIASGVINTLGALIRWLSFYGSTTSSRIAMLYTGSILCGLASPTATDTSTKTAALWFPENERLLANSVMQLGTPLGIALGSFIAPAIVNQDPALIPALNRLMFILAAIFGLSSFLASNNPSTGPPSASAAARQDLPFWDDMQLIVKNGPFWILVWVFAVIIATFGTMVTFVSNYAQPFGYTETDCGNQAIVMVGSGILMSLVVGYILDRTKAHRPTIKILVMLFLAGTGVFYLGCVNPGQLWVLYAGSVLAGIGGIPVVGIAMELGAECSYPVAEAISSGILMLSSQVLTMAMIAATNSLIDPLNGTLWRGLILIVAFAGSALVAAMFYSAPNRRMDLEKQYEERLKLANVE